MARVNHTINLTDCQCGQKFLIFLPEQSDSITGWQRRALKKCAKVLGREFAESSTNFVCPGCSLSIDLSKPDERQRWVDGERVE
jgi:hypothetical protein